MSRTLTQLVQGTSRRTNPRVRFETTHGTGAAGSYTSDRLTDRPNDWYNNMWFYNATDDASWRVSDFAGSTGALSLAGTGTPTSTASFELHAFHPVEIVAAINDAAQQLSDVITRTRIDNSYVTDSPLFNAGFEDTTGATNITGWQTSAVTATRHTTAQNKLGGSYSVALTGTAGYIEPIAEFQNMLLDLAGHNITVYYYAKTSTASSARLRIVADGVTTNGSYHTGGGGWELVSVQYNLPDPLDSLTVRLVRDGNGTDYWDNGWIEGGPRMYHYRLPASMDRGPGYIRILRQGNSTTEHNFLFQNPSARPWGGWSFQREEDAASSTTRNILRVDGHPPSFGRWLMTGWEPLNPLAARADVAEISEESAELLEVKAALLLIERSGRPEFSLQYQTLAAQYADLRRRIPETLKVAML